MAYITQTFAGSSLAQRWADFSTQYKAASAKRKVYRNTLAELSGLSNRELNDLGINRSSIKHIAMDAAGYE